MPAPGIAGALPFCSCRPVDLPCRPLLFLPLLLLPGGCAPAPSGPVLGFHGVGEGTELGATTVQKGADRGAVEWALLADLAGEDRLVEELSKHFHFERLHSDADLERILAKEFSGVRGKGKARALWKRYRFATFSGQEADNDTIVFFDSAGKAVTAWPGVEDLR